MKNFFDISSFTDKNERVFCYRSGNAVLEESFEDGVLYSAGNNAAGYPLNVLSNCNTRLNPYDFAEPFSFNAVIDGETVCRGLSFEGIEIIEDGKHAAVSFLSSDKEIKITIHTLVDGSEVFTRYIEIKNLSASAKKISKLVLHGGALERTDFGSVSWYDNENEKNVYDIGYFRNDDWGREGEFDFTPLQAGTTCVDCKFGVSRFRHPSVFIRNNLSGKMFNIQCGWSGGVRFSFNNLSRSSCGFSALSYSVELTGYAPLYILEAGETLVTPEIHICIVHGGIDKAVNESIKHIRRSVLPNKTDLAVGGGMGAEHDMSVETSMAFAKQLHDMGAEIFIIDAGWVCPPHKETEWHAYNGINRFNAERYPDDGLMRIRDYCHSIGMKFAMWMEPERYGDRSGIKEKHPEWVGKNVFGGRTEGFLDFTNPEVVEWVESEISYVIETYGLELLRIDYNINGCDCFGFNEKGECIALRHYSEIYKMFARLKAKYPEVVFENCAGGGGRTDLGFLKNFNHTWVSDNQVMPRSTEITNGMTMVLPPERVDRLFAGMGCHILGDMKSHLRNTMLGHMSLNVIAPAILEANSDMMEFIRKSVKLYKEEIRAILPECLVYHHTPTRKEIVEKGYTCLEIAAPNGEKGFFTVFSVPKSNDTEIVIRPKGILQGKNYIVYLDNFETEYKVSGRELADGGIRIRIDSSLSSELVGYKAE